MRRISSALYSSLDEGGTFLLVVFLSILFFKRFSNSSKQFFFILNIFSRKQNYLTLETLEATKHEPSSFHKMVKRVLLKTNN
jgi:hypothetical protein